MENWVRRKVNKREATVGCFLGLGSPHVAELLAHAGYDWLVLETEHSAVDVGLVEHMMMAVRTTETIPIVRVPTAEPIAIQRALDAGAMGILAPMVRTASEVQAIVDWTRYPPQGSRGFGPLRASAYCQNSEDYFRTANDNILVAIILETKEAVDNLASIAAVPGLDVIFVGPFDLCLAHGLDPFQMPHPEVEEILELLLRHCTANGVAAGFGVGSPDELQFRLEQGFTFLSYGTDYNLLRGAASVGLDAFRDATGG